MKTFFPVGVYIYDSFISCFEEEGRIRIRIGIDMGGRDGRGGRYVLRS